MTIRHEKREKNAGPRIGMDVRSGSRLLAAWTIAVLLVTGIPIPLLADETQGNANGAKKIATLNSQTWQMAEGLLPEEFLARYRDGQWSTDIFQPPPSTVFADQDFLAAGHRNEGRYDIGPKGQVIEIDTGKQPRFIYGPPFPTIDKTDPKAGTKVVWNFFYQSYLLGNSRNFVNLDWVGVGGLERRLQTEVYQRFFDGQPEKYRPPRNGQNLLFQQISGVSHPADLQGTVALTHRFRDPDQRDLVWSFVPALRRVRAVSPANRSDGFMGSDMSQDDGSYFDGKPEDFDWKLVGSGEVLMLYDRVALIDQKQQIRPLDGGGFESRDSLRPRFSYQSGALGEFPWQPLSSEYVLVKRPVWIVEGTPHDSYYLYGKIVLRFDKESWRGTYSSKYDWKGTILNSYLPCYGPYYEIDGEWRSYASSSFTLAQNWKLNRATVSYADPKNPVAQSRIRYPDNYFNVEQLSRRGK